MTELRVVSDRPLEPPPGRRMRLLRWRKFKTKANNKVRCIGAAEILLPNGLEIHGVLIFDKRGEFWANLPSAPRLATKAGILELARDAGGRPIYDSLLVWGTPELRRAFSDRVVALVREDYPGDFVA